MQKIRKKNHSTFEPWEAPGNEVWELVLVETPPPFFFGFCFYLPGRLLRLYEQEDLRDGWRILWEAV